MDPKVDQVIELIRKYQQVLLSKQRIIALEKEFSTEKKNHILLEVKCEMEYQDIVDLEKKSIRFLFNKILKNDEEQMEKEKQEYLVAVLALNESTKILELLNEEIKKHIKISETEEVVLQTLTTSLKITEEEHLRNSSSFLAELKDLTIEITKLIKFKLEIEEALDAVNMLRDAFLDLIKNLNRAKEARNWGVFYHEIQEAKANSKSYIDKAHACIPLIRNLLIILKSELADVKEYQDFFKTSGVVIRGFNIEFYNNLILDWINDENLIETISTTMSANTTILRLEKWLEKLIVNIDVELPHLLAKRTKLMEQVDLD